MPTTGNTRPRKDDTQKDFGLRRSMARLAAVQALYRHASMRIPLPQLLNEFLTYWTSDAEGESLKDVDVAFFDDIVSGVVSRSDELDALVRRFLGKGWSLERLDRLMLQILRAGAYEMLARPDVPRAVVVTEYVDVADAFYGRTEVGFVNALLDRLGRDTREA